MLKTSRLPLQILYAGNALRHSLRPARLDTFTVVLGADLLRWYKRLHYAPLSSVVDGVAPAWVRLVHRHYAAEFFRIENLPPHFLTYFAKAVIELLHVCQLRGLALYHIAFDLIPSMQNCQLPL
jgi:hypothetical protein